MVRDLGVVEYSDWLKKQPVSQVPSNEPTIIYSKFVMSLPFTCSFLKPAKNTVLYCTISLYINLNSLFGR